MSICFLFLLDLAKGIWKIQEQNLLVLLVATKVPISPVGGIIGAFGMSAA